MERDQHKTEVIFRVWKEDIIAIFPAEPWDQKPHHCACYMHIGQHSACDPDYIIQNSYPATPAHYSNLRKELEDLGYNLDIKSRYLRRYFDIRKDKIINPQKYQAYASSN